MKRSSVRQLAGLRIKPVSINGSPSVSVVIPCYNYARFLPEAVASALAQSDVQVDVIIVDDASSDDSLDVAHRLAHDNPRVRVIAKPMNSGPVDTFNRGLSEAKGEFLVRLDADDLLTPGALARAVAVFQAFPGVGLVYGHPIHFSDGLPIARETARDWLVWRGMDWLSVRCETGTNVITSPEVVMRRSVIDVVGGQRDLAHTHDMEMWFRIAAHSDIAYVVGADQAWHREHDASLSNLAEDPRVILGEIRDAFDMLFDEWTATGLAPDALRSRSRIGVACQAIDYARTDIDRGTVTERARELIEMANALAPSIMRTRRGRSATAALRRAEEWPRGLAALRGAAPRMKRRIRSRIAIRRWTGTGVYEPTTSTRLPARIQGRNEENACA